jgi:hypothetical protein
LLEFEVIGVGPHGPLSVVIAEDKADHVRVGGNLDGLAVVVVCDAESLSRSN